MTNRVCSACTNAPQYATYTTPASCAWICKDGYFGASCAPCVANVWCAKGKANQCPPNSFSLAGSSALSDCTCNAGYTTLAAIQGTCVPCTAGTVCTGGVVITVTVSAAPLIDVPSQIMLVQQTIAPATNLVSLFQSIPASLATIKAKLPSASMTVYTSQICRGTYCVPCDGSATCVPMVTVAVTQGLQGQYTFSPSSVAANSLVTFNLVGNPCVPTIGLPYEYLSGLVAAVSSISGITYISFSCPTNAFAQAYLPVTGTAATRRRRVLLQADGSDTFAVSVVVPKNLTNATQAAVAGANLTVQGYMPVSSAVVLVASANGTIVAAPPSLRCPENSTSPIGASSISQCVCLPGYRGQSGLGLACSPCAAGVFCSGGIIGQCPANAMAPPMSNSSANCACNPGFYGSSACYQCPPNAFCLGGRSFTNCTANALSPAQSASASSCHCAPGYSGTGNAPCLVCAAGSWCSAGLSYACPMNKTSSPGAATVDDCFCADGYSTVSGTGACLLCSNNTYCKVRACAKPIYNAARRVCPDDDRAERRATVASFPNSSTSLPRRRRGVVQPRPVFERHDQLLLVHR